METFGIQTRLVQDINGYERYNISEVPVGTSVYGRLSLRLFENEDEEKGYDNLAINIIDDDNEEVVRCYCNIPHKTKWINKSSDFYRTTFDFIFSYLKLTDETLVLTSHGDEINSVNVDIDWEEFIEYLDDKNVTVLTTEGNKDSDYNSFIITKLE